MRRARDDVLCEATAVLFARRTAAGRSRHAWEARTAWLQRRRRAGWTGLDIAFMTALFGIFVLNMLDITITLLHTGRVGWEAEANWLIRSLAVVGGDLVPVVFKVLVISVAVAIMWFVYRRTQVALYTARDHEARRRAGLVLRTQLVATGFLVLLYSWVIQNNVRVTF